MVCATTRGAWGATMRDATMRCFHTTDEGTVLAYILYGSVRHLRPRFPSAVWKGLYNSGAITASSGKQLPRTGLTLGSRGED
ncbi:unnamed protein product [Chondrus crispus]|uniref:Uncharacterized protein n=1 Tax=Chondrus crispus TaxID=2769 RepID=R7QDB1_CHOCR|nr:unnamed protein product [Chondrus crispus]CDF35773.1 unnamed protein product [Chondrus crispus]|eukprot:XP_005715592.1 unnamed protein product [Chondrus crispus]